jgi:hypothetical protein
MKKRRIVIVCALAIVLVPVCAALAQVIVRRQAPLVIPLNEVRMEIADIFFTTEVQGAQGRAMKMKDPERLKKYRLALVTIKVTKPPRRKLKIAAADLSLHYSHGNGVEVAICEGISVFNRTRDEDRLVHFPRSAGPGFVKQTTGVRATQADVVYFDAVFQGMEPDTRDVWLCVGQPTSRKPFVCRTPAWKP